MLQVVAVSPLLKYGFPTTWMKKVQIGAHGRRCPLAFRLLPSWTDRVVESGTSATAYEVGYRFSILNERMGDWSMKKIFGNSRGQIAVLYAGIAAVLLGAVALGADVAVMYTNWQQAQKTADAAAIAGATFLTGLTFSGTPETGCTGQSDDAEKAACTYAVKNGIDASFLTLSEPTTTSIKVAVNETGLPYFFGSALGLTTYAVKVSATAQGPGNIQTCVNCGMFPVALNCTSPCSLSSLDPGQSVSFGSKFVNGLAPGNWQWLSLGGSGSSVLGTNVDSGATGSYTIAPSGTGQTCNAGATDSTGAVDCIDTSTGNKGNSSDVNNGFSNRMSRCRAKESGAGFSEPCGAAAQNPRDIPADDPCLVIVPAINFGACTGNCIRPIEGFALIYLDATSSSTEIDGCFVSNVTQHTIASATAPALGGLAVDALTN